MKLLIVMAITGSLIGGYIGWRGVDEYEVKAQVEYVQDLAEVQARIATLKLAKAQMLDNKTRLIADRAAALRHEASLLPAEPTLIEKAETAYNDLLARF